MTHVVVNGNAYSDDGSSSRDMRLGGYRHWLLPMIADQMIEVRDAPEKSAAAAQAAQDAQHAAEVASAASMGYRNESRAARDAAMQSRTDAQTFANQAGQSANNAAAANVLAQQAAATAVAVGPGWSPVLALVLDGIRAVHRVVDFVGGTGNKPVSEIGKYIGAAGYVTDIADGKDVRGLQGDHGIALREAPAAGIVSAPPAENNGSTMLLEGYGLYVWDAASTLAADRETVIEGTGVVGAGRWLLRLPAWEFVWAHLLPEFDNLISETERQLRLARDERVDATAQQLQLADLQATVDQAAPLRATAVLDFASIAAGRTAYLSIPVAGAAVGMPVALGPPVLPVGLIATAYVAAAGSVSIGLTNTTTAAVDPAAASYTVKVLRG